MTDDSDIENARRLLEKAEREQDSKLKVDTFRDGFESLDSCVADGITDLQRDRIEKLRRAYVRSFLLQLDSFAAVPDNVWIDVLLLCAALAPQIASLRRTEPKLGDRLERFLEPRRQELVDALRSTNQDP